jgi:serine/threonine-protein kinase
MPEPAPAPAPADRNLLFGILALQMDFVTRDALLTAMNAWVLAKHKPLGQILVEQGGLAPEEHALVEAVVHRHVHNHGGDPQRSLAAVSSLHSLRQELEQVADPDLQASLALVSAGRPAEPDPNRTSDYAAGTPASAGTPTAAGQRFRVLRPHAKGGLGEVFVARDQELHRDVALKEIQGRFAHDRQSRSRFLLEAEVTGGLEHPGVVPVYGLGAYPDGRPFYAMRLVRGDSLKDAIRRFHQADVSGRDPGERTLALRGLLGRFVAVCNAVAYAHSRGVIHRDLKPSNVMLGPYGETLVVDWGLAKVVGSPAGTDGAAEGTLRPPSASGSDPTRMGSAIGTPSYMSPEQAAGKVEELGPASDVYSLGATLYCLLTGRAPLEGPDAAEVLRRVQQGDFPPPRAVQRGVPAALEAVCLKALAPRPADRYGSARALADEVEHWLADEPVTAYRDPATVRLARWGRRHQPVVAGVAAILLTTVVALGAGILAVNEERKQTVQERQRTQEALDAESRQRRKARQALDAMSSKSVLGWLSEERKGKLTGEQQQFLEQAVDSYEEFAADTGQDEAARAGAMDACSRVAQFQRLLARPREAEAAYRRALQIGEGLSTDFPATSAYRSKLASAHWGLGWALLLAGRAQEAEASHRTALQINRSLAAEFPTEPRHRLQVATTLHDLSRALTDSGRQEQAMEALDEAIGILRKLVADFPSDGPNQAMLGEALKAYTLGLFGKQKFGEAVQRGREAVELWQKLVKQFPDAILYRRSLGRAHSTLADVLANTGHLETALASYREAVPVFRTLVLDDATQPDNRMDLATSLTGVGMTLSLTDHPKEAEAPLSEAVTVTRQLAADFPGIPDYRHSHANLLRQKAWHHVHHKEPRSALPLLEEAMPHVQAAIAANPKDPAYPEERTRIRMFIALAHLRLQDHSAAAEATSRMMEDLGISRKDGACIAAGLLAQCVPLAEKDARLSASKRAELSAAYTNRAMACLQQAVREGFKDAAHIRKDTDLDPLRGRDDFRKLLAELEKGAGKGKPSDDRPKR